MMLKKYLLIVISTFCLATGFIANAEETGRYIVNGVIFEIPKRAVAFGAADKEGVIGSRDILPLLLEWPDMKPASGDKKKRNDEIQITIQSGEPSFVLTPEGKRMSRSYSRYNVQADVFDTLTEVEIDGKRFFQAVPDAEPILLHQSTNEKFGLDYYKLPHVNSPNVLRKDFFIKGNPFNPDYWVYCETLICHSAFELDEKISVRYIFKKSKLFAGDLHFKIRDQIKEKLNHFMLKE